MVIAAARNPGSSYQLHARQCAEGSELHVIQLDVSNEASIRTSVDKVTAILDQRGLDYLYNNAGIVCLEPFWRLQSTSDRRDVEQSAEGDAFDFSYEQLLAVLQANVAAPALLASLYLPLLERGGKKTIVNVGSGMGSHTLLKDGESGMMAYYVSKAAVNMLVRTPFPPPPVPSLPVESVC